MKKRMNAPSDEAEVNMTPMLDIVFIMLIFFIVASTLVRESGLDMTQKQNQEDEQPSASNTALVVQLCADDTVYVDHRAVDIRAVRANVEARLAAEPQTVVVIETQEQASTGSLVTIMDQAIAARAAVSIADQSAACVRNS